MGLLCVRSFLPKTLTRGQAKYGRSQPETPVTGSIELSQQAKRVRLATATGQDDSTVVVRETVQDTQVALTSTNLSYVSNRPWSFYDWTDPVFLQELYDVCTEVIKKAALQDVSKDASTTLVSQKAALQDVWKNSSTTLASRMAALQDVWKDASTTLASRMAAFQNAWTIASAEPASRMDAFQNVWKGMQHGH